MSVSESVCVCEREMVRKRENQGGIQGEAGGEIYYERERDILRERERKREKGGLGRKWERRQHAHPLWCINKCDIK